MKKIKRINQFRDYLNSRIEIYERNAHIYTPNSPIPMIFEELKLVRENLYKQYPELKPTESSRTKESSLVKKAQ